MAVAWGIAIAVVEAVQVAMMLAVLPLVGLLVEPSLTENSRSLIILREWLGQPSLNNLILILGGGALGLLIVGHLGGFVVQAGIEIYTSRIQTRLAAETMAQVVESPYPWYLDQNSASLSRIFHNDFGLWGREFIGNLLRVFTNLATIAIGAGIVLITSPLAGLAALLLVSLLTYGALRIVQRPLTIWTIRKRDAAQQTMVMETQIFSGIKDIKAAGANRHFVRLFSLRFGEMSRSAARGVVYAQMPTMFLLMMAQLSLLIIMLTLWLSGSHGGELAAMMTLIMLVVFRVAPAITRLTAISTSITNALPWVQGVVKLRADVRLARRQWRSTGDASPPDEWLTVRFRHTSYSYPGRDDKVLHDIDLDLHNHRAYGFIGASGAGKSTLIDLFLGLLQPVEGEISIDSLPLASVDLAAWRKKIGYVSQNPSFLDDTLKANVALGVNPAHIDLDLLQRSLSLAGLDDLIQHLPEGVDTILGDRAIRLSGGQRQRIAIARALYRRPDILILDEATAALDPTTEAGIVQLVRQLKKHVMILIISHRPAIVAPCDQIFELSAGRVVKTGSFEDFPTWVDGRMPVDDISIRKTNNG